jgi:hypothetical protein
MTKPVTKTAAPPLVHHPSDALDNFGRYDATSTPWVAFDEHLTEQLQQFEEANRRYWTPKAIRRSIGR